MGLFSIALALVVAGAATVFGLQQYDAIATGARASETQQMLVQVAADMQAAYRTRNSYGAANADLTAVAVGLNLIPRDYHTGDDTAESPFRENLTVTAQDDEFDIDVEDLDEEECSALLTRPWRTGELQNIEVGDFDDAPDNLDPADVENECDGADNDVTFTFR